MAHFKFLNATCLAAISVSFRLRGSLPAAATVLETAIFPVIKTSE